jgi:hypothetical protein
MWRTRGPPLKQQQRTKSSLEPNTLKQPQEQQIHQCFAYGRSLELDRRMGIGILHAAMTTTTTASHSNHVFASQSWVSCRAWCALHKRRVVPWTAPQPFHRTPFPNNTIVEYKRVRSEPRAGKGILALPERMLWRNDPAGKSHLGKYNLFDKEQRDVNAQSRIVCPLI